MHVASQGVGALAVKMAVWEVLDGVDSACDPRATREVAEWLLQ